MTTRRLSKGAQNVYMRSLPSLAVSLALSLAPSLAPSLDRDVVP